jgi:O-antigen/teichoic acid export membrane protein
MNSSPGDEIERLDDPGRRPERSSIRRNVFHMLSSQLFTWVLATILAIVVPRYLGPGTQGQLRLAYAVWMIVGIFAGMGTSSFLQLQIAKRPADGLRLVGSVLVVRTLAFVLAAIVVVIYVGVAGLDRQLTLIMMLIGILTLLGSWSEAVGTAFIGLERMSIVATSAAVGKALNTIAVIVVILVGGNVYVIVLAGVVSSTWSLGYLSWSYRRIGPVVFHGWTEDARSVVRSSVPFMAAGVALVVYQQIDIVVISWVAGDADVGWYGTADNLFGSLLFPATIIMGTMFPAIGRLHQDDPHALGDLVARAFSALVLAAVPIGLGVTLIAPTFAPLLFGQEFRQTGTVLAVLGPVIILTFGTILFGTVALGTGRNRLWVWVMVAAALLTIPLDLVLVPWAHDRFGNGAIGGAIAYVVTESIQFGIGVWKIAPFVVHPRTLWRTARVLVAGAVMFAVGWPLRAEVLPVPVIVCGVVYVAMILILRVLTDEQRRAINAVGARLGLRSNR